MERWRWKNSDFEAVQVRAGEPLPKGVEPDPSPLCPGVLGYAAIRSYPMPVRDGEWVRYTGEGESRRIVAVMTDERIREQAVCLEE